MSETTRTGRTTPPPTEARLGWLELGVAVVSFLVLSFAVGFLTVGLGLQLDVPGTIAINSLLFLASAAIALAIRVRRPSALGLRPTSWRWLLIGLGAGVAAMLANRIVVLVYVLLTGDLSNPQADIANAAAPAGWPLLGLMLAGAVLAPLAEELFFRGVVYGALRRHGVLLATLVSALLFGLAHGISVLLPATALIGVVNALLYERSKSIWPSVVAHAVNNAILFTLAAILL